MGSNNWLNKVAKDILPDEPVSLVDVLKDAINLYAKNFVLLTSLVILSNVFELINLILRMPPNDFMNPRYWLLAAVNTIIAFFAIPATITAVANKYQGVEVTLKDAFVRTYGRYWRFLGCGLGVGIISFFGYLLLVLPGIYWGTIYSLAAIVAVIGKCDIMSPFHVSRELIKGSFMKVFCLGFLSFVINLAIVLFLGYPRNPFGVSFVSPVIAAPLHVVLMYLLGAFWVCVEVVLFYKLEKRKNALIEKGKVELKFRGRFKNDKGETITYWWQAPNEDALKAHLSTIGWEIVEIQSIEYVDRESS